MKRKHLLVMLVFVLMISLVSTALVSADPIPLEPNASPDAAPPIAAPGYYLVGSKNLDPGQFFQGGDMQFFSWAQLQPNPGANGFYWSALDAFIAEHRSVNGRTKGVGISITPYDGREAEGILMMPEWARNADTQFMGYDGNQIERTNYSFENDLTYWSASTGVEIRSGVAHQGNKSARMGGALGATHTLQRGGVRIPVELATDGVNEITYWWRTEATGSDPGDVLKVELLEGSTVLAVMQSVANTSGNSGWQQHTFSLLPHQGKWVTLRFTVTTNDSGPDTAFYVDEVAIRSQHYAPKFWSPEYLELHRVFVDALGERYRNNPDVAFISIGTGKYGETRATGVFDNPAVRANGLPDSAAWVATVNAITDQYVEAFSQGGRLRKVLLLQNAPFQFNAGERRDFSDYAAWRKVGLSFNGLYWQWNYAETAQYPYSQVGATIYGTAAFDSLIRYRDSVAVGFETYNYMLGDIYGTIPNEQDYFYWATLVALDAGTDYVRLSNYDGWYLGPGDQPNTAYTDIMRWAAPYFGAGLDPNDIAPPPSVWVALRDHVYPACYWLSQGSCESSTSWPPLGNFNFFLYQLDEVPGGRTVPETSLASWGNRQPAMGLCPPGSPGPDGYPCNEYAYNWNLPKLKRESLMIRRTDQGTSNPYMFFDVDDRYMYDGVNTAEITITYWDRGTDKFRLQYDSTTGPQYARPVDGSNAWVQKQGSNEFRKAIFRLTDARFADRLTGNVDFVLDSRDENGGNDGDEWIHFVDVRKIDSTSPTSTPTPTPTATLTPTPTATPTATPTSTPVPTVGNLLGQVFVDANGNGTADVGEERLAGVSVTLKNGSGAVVGMVVSANEGSFSFQDLAPGTYKLQAASSNGYFQRPREQSAQIAAGETVQVPLPHYAYRYLFLPMLMQGDATE